MRDYEQWAEGEFGGAELGDPRRTARAVKMAARAAERPAGTVTSVVRGEAQREGAFRFLRNSRVSAEALGRSSHAATLRRWGSAPFVFVALDQSSLGLTDASGSKDFGRVGKTADAKKRGLQAMTALAVNESGRVLGVCGQRWWRRLAKSPAWKEDRRPVCERESSLWGDVIDDVESLVERMRVKTRPWYQLDRGGDAWHVLRKAADEGLWITVRAAHDRALESHPPEISLRAAVASRKPVASFRHYLRPAAAKRAGHSPLRPRHLEIRYCPVTLALKEWDDHKGTRRAPASYHVIHLREKSPPPGVRRLEWFLLTTYPVASAQDALRVAQGYTLRWRIEEFHKTWKSGACNVEQSQLRSSESFKRWATLLAAVASRIERLKQSARTRPDTPALELATRDEIDGAIALVPECKWRLGAELTIEQFVLLVADVGGYTGRSSGGPPGSIVIARGLDRVVAAAAGLAAARRAYNF
jgi:hypothetical protein